MASEAEHPWKLDHRCQEFLFDHPTTTGQLPTERQTLLDLLTAKDLVENKVVDMRWVPTYKQHADYLTKLMLAWLRVKFNNKGLISLRETTEEAQEEDRRRGLRKAQRQRRKECMRRTLPAAQTCRPAASGAKSTRSGRTNSFAAHQHPFRM